MNVVNLFADTTPLKGSPVEHPRWSSHVIPHSYRVTTSGLLKLSEEKPAGEVIAGPIVTVAQTQSPGGGGAGLVLEIETRTGQIVNVPIPRTRLHEDAQILARDLADLNFYIGPGREKELLKYLGSCVQQALRTSVKQTGWAPAADIDKLVYVLPDRATDSGYHFQPERFSPSSSSIRSSGTLKTWNDNVFASIRGRAYPLFALLVSLCGPTLKWSQMDSGGFHFHGGSSSGKTTLAQIAASVWGCGADPADAPDKAYIRRWNATLNAMEVLSASHNDMCLILDEIGSCNSKDFGRAVYDITGGQGKAAMDAGRNLKAQRAWRTMLFSTGEVSSRSKIEENAKAKAGQLLRMIDIEVKPAMFESRAQVDKLKRACSQYYGVLGPAFIEAIVARYDAPKLRAVIQSTFDSAHEELMRFADSKLEQLGAEINAVQERALKRFALAQVAGMLLVELKIVTGLTRKQVIDAVQAVVSDWLPASIELHDVERAIIDLQSFVIRNRESRFKVIGETSSRDPVVRDIGGYWHPIRRIFYLLPSTMREATGMEPKVVATRLEKLGLLVEREKAHLSCRPAIDGQRIRVYAISAKLMGDESDSEDDNV